MGPSRNWKTRNRFSLQSLQEGMQPWPQLEFSQERPMLGFSQTELCMCSVWLFAAPMDCRPWDSPGKNTGVGCHVLPQAILPTQGWNPSLLHLLLWQVGSLPLVPLGKPRCSLTVHKMHEPTIDLPHGASNLFCQLQGFKEWGKLRVGKGFPGGSDGKESACNAEDPGLIPGLRRYPGEGNGNPLQYFCLENSMDRGAWQVTSLGSQRVGRD